MKKILNLTQHAATPDQVAAGVVEPADKALVQQLLTFEEPPTWQTIKDRAQKLGEIALGLKAQAAMIGGAPFFMAPLEFALLAHGVRPLYSFTKRESVEVPDENGGVRKTQIFRHIGFVDVLGESPTFEAFVKTGLGELEELGLMDVLRNPNAKITIIE